MKDLHNNIVVKRVLSPVSVADNTAQVGEIIDLQGMQGCEFVILAGSLGDAGAEFTPTVDEGDASNLSDAAAVSSSSRFLGTLAGATFDQSKDNKVYKLGFVKGTKRYVRLTLTPTNNATAALLAAVAVLSPELKPQSTQES